MEHQTFEQLRGVADLHPAEPRPTTRRERLDRWAALLEAQAGTRLNALPEIEFRSRAERVMLRSENSPLTVAFADPVLRLEGLSSDRLGDGMEFFSLTEREVHTLLCSCMGGASMDAREAGRRVRKLAGAAEAVGWRAWLVGLFREPRA